MQREITLPPRGAGRASHSERRLRRLERLFAAPGVTEEEMASERKRLLRYCRRYRIGERCGWQELAVYSQEGEAGLSGRPPLVPLFDVAARKLRQKILNRLLREGAAVRLKELCSLLHLLERFGERVRFLSDIVVENYLARERATEGDACGDAQPYLRWFTNKLFRELDVLASGLSEEPLMKAASCRYEWWVTEKLLDEEALL